MAGKKSDTSLDSRASASRTEILNAAVRCLATRGYQGTTTLQIQKDAGVSRGKLLHYFPSRQALLIAAVEHLAQQRFQSLRTDSLTVHGIERINTAIERLWASYSGELFWASAELWMAARTDEELQNVLRNEERRLGAVARALCDELFGVELNIHPRYPALRDVLMSSMRGAAITYTFEGRDMSEEQHLARWCELSCLYLDLDAEALPAALHPSTAR